MTILKEKDQPHPQPGDFAEGGRYSAESWWPETVTRRDVLEMRKRKMQGLVDQGLRMGCIQVWEGMPLDFINNQEIAHHLKDRGEIEAASMIEMLVKYGADEGEARPIVLAIIQNYVKLLKT